MRIHIVEPVTPPRGTVIVLHDIFGTSDYVDDVLQTLAGSGWRAVAPALFHRDGIAAVAYNEMQGGLEAAGRLTAAHVIDDYDEAVQFAHGDLTGDACGADHPPTAIIGFCLGGGLASFIATRRSADAVVSFYGGVMGSEAQSVPAVIDTLAHTHAPWLGIYGEHDEFIPLGDVHRLEQRLPSAPLPAEVLILAGGHAFHRHTTPDYYRAASAAAAWQRATDWLERYVEPGA